MEVFNQMLENWPGDRLLLTSGCSEYEHANVRVGGGQMVVGGHYTLQHKLHQLTALMQLPCMNCR